MTIKENNEKERERRGKREKEEGRERKRRGKIEGRGKKRETHRRKINNGKRAKCIREKEG